MLLEKPWLATTPFQGAVLVRKVSDAAADLSGGEGRGSLSGFETCAIGGVSRGSKGSLIDSELPLSRGLLHTDSSAQLLQHLYRY